MAAQTQSPRSLSIRANTPGEHRSAAAKTKQSFPPEVGIGGRFTDALKRRGIWIRVGSYILPVSPPLSITAQEIDELCDAVEEALVEVSAGLGK